MVCTVPHRRSQSSSCLAILECNPWPQPRPIGQSVASLPIFSWNCTASVAAVAPSLLSVLLTAIMHPLTDAQAAVWQSSPTRSDSAGPRTHLPVRSTRTNLPSAEHNTWGKDGSSDQFRRRMMGFARRRLPHHLAPPSLAPGSGHRVAPARASGTLIR